MWKKKGYNGNVIEWKWNQNSMDKTCSCRLLLLVSLLYYSLVSFFQTMTLILHQLISPHYNIL